MRGIVKAVNRRTGMAAIQAEDGEFSIVEQLGPPDLEVGDVVSGELDSLGGETLRLEATGEAVDVYIQDVHGSRATLAPYGL